MFSKDMSDKKLLSKIYEELVSFNNKTTWLERGPKTLADI